MYLFPHVCKVWGMISIRRLYFEIWSVKKANPVNCDVLEVLVVFALPMLCSIMTKTTSVWKKCEKNNTAECLAGLQIPWKRAFTSTDKNGTGKVISSRETSDILWWKTRKNTRKYEFAASFLGLLFLRRDKMPSDNKDMCAFLLVEMAAIGAISFGQTKKVFKANTAEVKTKPKKPSVMTWHMYVVVKDNFKYPQ